MAMIPVEFMYTAPAPPVEAPATEPAPPQAKPAPPKKAQEKPKAPSQKKGEIPKPEIRKKAVPKTAVLKPTPQEAEDAVPKPASAQPVSNLIMTKQVFPFSYYARIVQQKVWREWDKSTALGQRKAVVLFQITRDGRVASVKTEKSSGDGLFDQAALRAVQLASPFPPLPAGYAEEALDVFFEFNFNE
ncbi:MAG: TonB C-terminal domain-containing protein [Elusimicrobia bacterium]|nr:TonB C-terminal domain-containing protein [Elusimicrobiota bacterium]